MSPKLNVFLNLNSNSWLVVFGRSGPTLVKPSSPPPNVRLCIPTLSLTLIKNVSSGELFVEICCDEVSLIFGDVPRSLLASSVKFVNDSNAILTISGSSLSVLLIPIDICGRGR